MAVAFTAARAVSVSGFAWRWGRPFTLAMPATTFLTPSLSVGPWWPVDRWTAARADLVSRRVATDLPSSASSARKAATSSGDAGRGRPRPRSAAHASKRRQAWL